MILTTGIRARRKSPRSVKMESSKIEIEKFDGSDFSFWNMRIEDYLYQKDLHEPLLGVMSDTITTEQWKLKDRQALGLIRLTLSRDVEFNIIKEKTTSDLLKALSSMYEKPSTMNKVYLMRRLFNLEMSEGGSELWDTVVAAISSSRGSDKLKFDEIRDVVLNENIRKQETENSSGSTLLSYSWSLCKIPKTRTDYHSTAVAHGE